MVCVQYVDSAVPDFETLLALHLPPIQKVAFSIALVNDRTQFLTTASTVDKLNFSLIFSQQLPFLFLSLKSLLLRW